MKWWLLFFCALLSADECGTMFEGDYFPQKELNIILKKYKVPAKDWKNIYYALLLLQGDVEKIVTLKADKMEKNPYTPPREEMVIGRLYKEAYFEIFTQVMKEYGIDDTSRIYEMYSQLEGEKADAIFRCYQKSR